MRKQIIMLFLLCLNGMARGQTEGYTYLYWFDDDLATLSKGSSTASDWQLTADVSALSESLHTIHLMVRDAEGRQSLPTTRLFMHTSGVTADTEAYYWFDNTPGKPLQSPMLHGSFSIDATSLSDGLHSIHYQARSKNGAATSPVVRYFLKMDRVENDDYINCLCSIDGQLMYVEKLPSNGGVIHWNFNMHDLTDGLHRIELQAVTKSGAMCNSYTGYFMRVTTSDELGELHCLYAIDNDHFNVADKAVLNNGKYHFDLDLSSLEDGLHHISYMLYNNRGTGTKIQTSFFIKVPEGGNGINKYQYWLNNDDISAAKTVVLAQKVNPLQLVSLLPMDSRPLRSEQFHFEVKNGQPTVYAKNTIHLRFYDVAMRFTDVVREYTDYSVSKVVTDAKQLIPDERETVEKPAENAIKWYKLTAEKGDSLSFRTDLAATLQLFAPSGKEVYNASGSEVVKWGGIHTEEKGTYYVALHDVTATQGTTISLDYKHIDRYAVLRQDILAAGNGGPSTVTFQGNGFDELQSVDLVLGSKTLTSTEISSADKATASVKWNFNGAALGQYKAVFHFKEGNVTIEKCITVEKAVPVTLTSTVNYASQFLVSQGNTYKYKVRNNGNMTAYDQKMQLTVYASDLMLLSWVAVDGKELVPTATLENPKEGYAYACCYELVRSLRPSTDEPLAVKVKTNTTGFIYVDLDGVGGPSEAVTAIDPNDIYGYQDENGSKVIRNGRTSVYYTIEFENDPAFATAAAHEIWVTDTLDTKLFDLSTFAPTGIAIGNKEVALAGEQNFAVTIDMRPEINALALVECNLDLQKGIVSWHISSLDTRTVEPSEDVMHGVLPVNHDGNGIGRLSFDISLKAGLPNGTMIPNRAGIKFDGNDVIVTPTWVNTIESNGEVVGVSEIKTARNADSEKVYNLSGQRVNKPKKGVYVKNGRKYVAK